MAFDPDKLADEFSICRNAFSEIPLHYLDNAAMAQVPDCVVREMSEHDTRRRSNVRRGVHYLAEAATEAFENARNSVAEYLGVNTAEVVFTSGATAAINFIAQSFGRELNAGDEIVLSQLEHHSNIVPWQMLQQRKAVTIKYIPVTNDGRIDIDMADEMISRKTRLVSISHGSNVTGAITDAGRIIKIAHERGARVMLDGAQVAPMGPLNLPDLGVDFYVFSGHKTYGPSGVGVLWGRMEIIGKLQPVFGGGEMIKHVSIEGSTYMDPPYRFEAGTPPVTQAVGLGVALEWIGRQDLTCLHEHLGNLVKKIMEGLLYLDKGKNRIRILGPSKGSPRLPLVSFTIKGIHPHDICQMLNDRHGVALRGGHHCAQPLHDYWGLEGSTRASLAMFNSMKDVDVLLNGLEDCIRILG